MRFIKKWQINLPKKAMLLYNLLRKVVQKMQINAINSNIAFGRFSTKIKARKVVNAVLEQEAEQEHLRRLVFRTKLERQKRAMLYERLIIELTYLIFMSQSLFKSFMK